MSGLEFGLVLPMLEEPGSGEKPSWGRIKSMAQSAEALGFDTVWVADELLWRVPDWDGPPGMVGVRVDGWGSRCEHIDSRGGDLGVVGSSPEPRVDSESRRDSRRDQ